MPMPLYLTLLLALYVACVIGIIRAVMAGKRRHRRDGRGPDICGVCGLRCHGRFIATSTGGVVACERCAEEIDALTRENDA